jgi:hypothetical protein
MRRRAALLSFLLVAGCARAEPFNYAIELPQGDNPMDALVREEPHRAHLIQERAQAALAQMVIGQPMEDALTRLQEMGAACKPMPGNAALCEYENKVSDLRYAKGELREERVTWFDWTLALLAPQGRVEKLSLAVTSTRPPLGSPVGR